jgi:hypothetical protein
MPDIDRSLAYTALLELDEEFGKLNARRAAEEVTALVTAWRTADSTDKWEFTRSWIAVRKEARA